MLNNLGTAVSFLMAELIVPETIGLNDTKTNSTCGSQVGLSEALKSFMCDIIKILLKRRIAMRTGKGNQPLNIKTAIERSIIKLGYPNFMLSFYFILLFVASLLFRHILMTSRMTLSSASSLLINVTVLVRP